MDGVHSSPIEHLMKRFQDAWDELDHGTADLVYFQWPENQDSTLYYQAMETLIWATTCLEKATFPREDNRELIELTVLFLGGKSNGKRTFTFRKPGAHHRARFMHNEIYFLKMYLLSKRFARSEDEL